MTAFVVISALVKIVVVLLLVLTSMLFLLWAERRLSAMMQDRLGPMRSHLPLGNAKVALKGLLQPLFDMMKFVFQEDFVPPRADKLLHSLAPIIAVVPVIVSYAIVPWGGTLHLDYLWQQLPAEGAALTGAAIPLQIASLNVGFLLIFAMGGTGVVGSAIAGYGSDNKYSLLGGLRAASQMVSYEVVLGLSLVGCFVVYDSLLLEEMVQWQIDNVWGFMVQPVALVLFLACSTAETKRIPFDAPEAEAELVGGYILEFSSLKIMLFKMGEYFELVLSSVIIVTLFFGGYHLPGLTPQGIEIGTLDLQLPLPHLLVLLIDVAVFVIKVAVVVWVQFIIRWTLPRFRYDQIMKLCWRYMLPLALLNIFVTGVVVMLVQ